MSSRHRFLQKSIHNVSFHNRLTEEDAMWRRRENEQDRNEVNKRQYRSRSPYERNRSARKQRPTDDEKKRKDNNPTESEFGPPLPSNLGINADRWDHALFMQRYPNDYEKQVKKSKREISISSDDEKKDRRKKKTEEEEKRKKTKRRHRSRS
jgi:hypothetical protein